MSLDAGHGLDAPVPRAGGRPTEPFVYRLPRRIARAAVPVAARSGVAPSTITVCWTLMLGLVGLLLAVNSIVASLGGVLILAVVLVLDCLDGELARATGRCSHFGGFLESFGQWIGGLAVVVGVAVAADASATLAMAAVAASATYHLLFVFAPSAFGTATPGPIVVRATRSLWWATPVDINVVTIAAVVGAHRAGLLVWVAMVAAATAVVVSGAVAASSRQATAQAPSSGLVPAESTRHRRWNNE